MNQKISKVKSMQFSHKQPCQTSSLQGIASYLCHVTIRNRVEGSWESVSLFGETKQIHPCTCVVETNSSSIAWLQREQKENKRKCVRRKSSQQNPEGRNISGGNKGKLYLVQEHMCMYSNLQFPYSRRYITHNYDIWLTFSNFASCSHVVPLTAYFFSLVKNSEDSYCTSRCQNIYFYTSENYTEKKGLSNFNQYRFFFCEYSFFFFFVIHDLLQVAGTKTLLVTVPKSFV